MYKQSKIVNVLVKDVNVCFSQDRGVKEDELQSILNYLLTMHEVNERDTKRWLSRAGGKNVHYNL